MTVIAIKVANELRSLNWIITAVGCVWHQVHECIPSEKNCNGLAMIYKFFDVIVACLHNMYVCMCSCNVPDVDLRLLLDVNDVAIIIYNIMDTLHCCAMYVQSALR